MSSSLDKLRALTSRLEEKLEEKDKSRTPTPEPVATVSEKPALSMDTEEVAPSPIVTVKPAVTVNGAENFETIRNANIARVERLYKKLKIYEKSPDFDNIFMYKAMNLSGIGLKEDDFGEVREGKYIQIIAITYEPDKYGKKKAKNISLGYFGKAETLDGRLKSEIIEFVLRWRYEKAFQNVEHYKVLIEKVEVPDEK